MFSLVVGMLAISYTTDRIPPRFRAWLKSYCKSVRRRVPSHVKRFHMVAEPCLSASDKRPLLKEEKLATRAHETLHDEALSQ